jgi:hypothetical protein
MSSVPEKHYSPDKKQQKLFRISTLGLDAKTRRREAYSAGLPHFGTKFQFAEEFSNFVNKLDEEGNDYA